MPFVEFARETHSPVKQDRAKAVCEEVRLKMEGRRDQVCQEISRYPTPIPACDVHFNRLLEERRRVFEDLDQLRELCPRGRARDIRAIENLIASSAAIDEADKARLRDALKLPGSDG